MNLQSNLKYIVPEEKYNIFAGQSWPRYDIFVTGKYNVSQEIKNEIKSLIDDCLDSIENKFVKQKKICLKKFIFTTALPAFLGVIAFIIISASWYKLLYLIPIAFLVDVLWNHALHKWLTHRQFEPKPIVKFILLWILTIPGHHKIKMWALSHLYHHRYSDTIEDPYTPKYGFLCLLIGASKSQKCQDFIQNNITLLKFPKEIDFIDKYNFQLYVCNLVLFFLIDIDLFLLSFFIFKFYAAFSTAFSGYILHGNSKVEPTNLKWYWSIILFGERLHKEHHKSPRVLNFTRNGRKNLYYYYIKLVAKNKS